MQVVLLVLVVLAALAFNLWMFLYVPLPMDWKVGIVVMFAMFAWLIMILDKPSQP